MHGRGMVCIGHPWARDSPRLHPRGDLGSLAYVSSFRPEGLFLMGVLSVAAPPILTADLDENLNWHYAEGRSQRFWGKGHHLIDALGVDQQHHQPVDAQGVAGRGGHRVQG